MGNFLHTLGAGSFKHKWRVVSIWVAILIILGISAAHFMKPPSTSISIPGTEAQKTLDRFAELFPAGGKGSGQIVFAAKDGKKIQDYKTEVTSLLQKVKATNGVTNVVSPYDNPNAISSDGTIAYASIQLKNKSLNSTSGIPTEIAKLTENARTASNLTVEVNGDLTAKGPSEFIGVTEIFGVVIALVVLAMTLGSLIAAGMPIVSALITVGISVAGLFS